MAQLPERILIVGGGFAGLAVAARLAQEQFPVTLIEGAGLGGEASSRNQGWLYSGAWFARHDAVMARLCYESLRQTIRFCPECLEPGHSGTLFFASQADADFDQWLRAWADADIPHIPVDVDTVLRRLDGIDPQRVCRPHLLPDRSIRTHTLLQKIADQAIAAGAEIRTNTRIRKLISKDGTVSGLVTSTGQEIRGSLVILATGAGGADLWGEITSTAAGAQPQFERIALLGHLVATSPGVCAWPFCVVDADGFNHMPHVYRDRTTSVFGNDNWTVVAPTGSDRADPSAYDQIESRVRTFFPGAPVQFIRRWSGATIQAMHSGQIHPGRAPYPTILDHETEPPFVRNVLSIYPGRATLWAVLAQQLTELILERFNRPLARITPAPWE